MEFREWYYRFIEINKQASYKNLIFKTEQGIFAGLMVKKEIAENLVGPINKVDIIDSDEYVFIVSRFNKVTKGSKCTITNVSTVRLLLD